jgi:hypothetical protein
MSKAIQQAISPIIDQNNYISELSTEKLIKLFNHGLESVDVVDISNLEKAPDDSIIDDYSFISDSAVVAFFFDENSEDVTIYNSDEYNYSDDLEEMSLPLPLHVNAAMDPQPLETQGECGKLDVGQVPAPPLCWQFELRLSTIPWVAGIVVLLAAGTIQLAIKYQSGTTDISSSVTDTKLLQSQTAASTSKANMPNMLAGDVKPGVEFLRSGPPQENRESDDSNPRRAIASGPDRERLSRADVERLIERGKRSFALGNVASARSIFRRAAESGDVEATFALGRTYDPTFLARPNIVGNVADAAEADHWYKIALERALAN